MDLLYRVCGLNGREIGEIFKIGYSAVNQKRKRLSMKINKEKKFNKIPRIRVTDY